MKVYGVITFYEPDQAEAAMKKFKSLEKEHQLELDDAIVVVKDVEGNIKVDQKAGSTTKVGAATGGAIGLDIGVMVGGPIGGALLGDAAGAFAGKKIDLAIPDERITAVSEAMENASSAILIEIEREHSNVELLRVAIKQSGGTIHEGEVESGVEVDLDETLNSFNVSGSN